jgi:hypothetical protein
MEEFKFWHSFFSFSGLTFGIGLACLAGTGQQWLHTENKHCDHVNDFSWAEPGWKTAAGG